MIITKLIGGLGNQMFQYAAGRSLAHANNTQLKLDISGYNNQKGITPRSYMLDIFNIQSNYANKTEIYKFRGNNILLRIFKMNPYIMEKQFYFDPKIHIVKDNSYLDGYWHSEKYFKNIEQIIRQEFTYINKPDKTNKELIKQIDSCNSVSVHVRLGDYVEDEKTNQFHGVCRLDYYKAAITHEARQVKSPHFFVFSDDPGWCKANLHLKYPTTYVTNNHGGKDYEDMRLMSECKHNIIANSSFSWWAAWLNQYPDKTVIAPKKWFNDKSINTRDLIPKSWIKI